MPGCYGLSSYLAYLFQPVAFRWSSSEIVVDGKWRLSAAVVSVHGRHSAHQRCPSDKSASAVSSRFCDHFAAQFYNLRSSTGPEALIVWRPNSWVNNWGFDIIFLSPFPSVSLICFFFVLVGAVALDLSLVYSLNSKLYLAAFLLFCFYSRLI